MKKIILLLLLVCETFLSTAQAPKYYRVKIFTDDEGLKQLALKGVGFDHGEYQKGNYFISEFSEKELNIIKQNHYPFQILVNDMTAYYVARSKTDTAALKEPVTTCSYPIPQNFKLGSMGGFYTYAEILKTLDSMKSKFPNLISIRKPASDIKTANGNKLFCVRISNKPNKEQDKPKILYTALHHAREPESATQLIFFMWYLLENYNSDIEVKNIINNEELYFIPCVNPDGYLYNQQTNPNGGGLWRKNRRNNGDGNYGVDLNRNYGYKWGFDNSGSSPYTFDETYRGPSAFSEPETQIIASFCQSRHFIMAINNHTYSNALIYPYGYKENTYTQDSAIFRQYAQQLTICNHFVAGTVNQTLGYIANGTSDDWMYGEQTLKPKVLALTPETGSYTDGFWPAPNRIIPIAQKNMQMNITAAQLAGGLVAPVAKDLMGANKEGNFVSKLYAAPNPSINTTVITYQLKEIKSKTTLVVTSAYGKSIQTVPLNNVQGSITLNTANLLPGVYYYSIVSGSFKSEVQKLLVIK